MTRLPIYTTNKKNGNIAESLVQFELSRFCLVHKIDGSYDIGNDFICELIKDQSPTNLLFYVQVKFTSGVNRPKIDPKTIEYWKGSPIPVFVFWVKEIPPTGLRSLVDKPTYNISYKRYTPIVHGKTTASREKFVTYSQGKFLDHLLIDYARSQYVKGFTPVVNIRDYIGMDEKLFLGFPRYMLLVEDVIPKYQDQILNKSWANLFSLATILLKNNDKESLEMALDLIGKAKTFYRKYVSGVDYSGNFVDDMALKEREILDKLERISE